MAYVSQNYKTKKEFVSAVKAGTIHRPYNPSGMFTMNDGPEVIEGPHYPKPHQWYSQVVVRNGVVVSAR